MRIPAKPPPQPAAATSGMYRLGAAASPASELRLAPISEDFRKRIVQQRLVEDEEDDSAAGYDVAPLNQVHVVAGSRAPSAIRVAYRRQMRSGIELLAKLSEFAYLVTWPFILLLLFGAATGQRRLAICGAVGVVLLSLARLAIDGFYLVAVHFKDNLREGLLFFVPPMTFYYLAKRWNTVKRVAARLLTSVALIAGVILAFAFVPTLSSSTAPTDATTGERVNDATAPK
jgi:hypothetical protein